MTGHGVSHRFAFRVTILRKPRSSVHALTGHMRCIIATRAVSAVEDDGPPSPFPSNLCMHLTPARTIQITKALDVSSLRLFLRGVSLVRYLADAPHHSQPHSIVADLGQELVQHAYRAKSNPGRAFQRNQSSALEGTLATQDASYCWRETRLSRGRDYTAGGNSLWSPPDHSREGREVIQQYTGALKARAIASSTNCHLEMLAESPATR